jgi:hypothetical protein
MTGFKHRIANMKVFAKRRAEALFQLLVLSRREIGCVYSAAGKRKFRDSFYFINLLGFPPMAAPTLWLPRFS